MEKIMRELEELRNKYQEAQDKYQETNDKYLESETERHKLENKNAELQRLVEYYEQRFRLSQYKEFASSSEKTDGFRQLLLFDEPENEAAPKKPEPTVEEITYSRRKRTGKREENFSSLPVVVVEHSIPEDERVCPSCGEQMHVMGHDYGRQELEIIPAQVRVIKHVREVYSCRRCDREGTSVPVTKAPIPNPVIKGSVASPSFVAHIMEQKYMNSMPLYRQEQAFLLDEFLLSRQTMANWLMRCSNDWLEPLYKLMRQLLLGEGVIHADETTVQVLKEPGRSSRAQSFMWLYRTGMYTRTPVVLYEYQPTRSSSHPKRFLEGYSGYLHTDGYSGYHNLSPGIVISGCWAHVRRKFNEAQKALSPEERNDSVSQKGLDFCNSLFELERKYENFTPEERYHARLERSKPVSDEFFAWAGRISVLPKSLLGKAIYYALSQRRYLENVYLDGRLELSNNRAERSIKPFVIGRKNWLFSCTPKGASASSIIYSVIETAKENKLKPFEYLKHIFNAMPNISPERYPELLPWSMALPQHCIQQQISEIPQHEKE